MYGSSVPYSHLSVQGLQILSELCDAVAFADFYTEALLLGHVGGKAAEALAATASHSHQQGIASGLHQDPVNAAHMQNSIPATRQSQKSCVSVHVQTLFMSCVYGQQNTF